MLFAVEGNLLAASQALGVPIDDIVEERDLRASNGALFRADIDGTRYLIKSPPESPMSR